MNKKEWIDAKILNLGVENTEANPNTNIRHDGVIVGYIGENAIEGHS